MNVIRFLYFIATIVEVAKSSAEADDVSLLAQRLFKSKHILRGSGLNDEKEAGMKDEETSVNRSPKRILEAGTKRLLQLKSINGPSPILNYEEIFVASDGRLSDNLGWSCSISGDLVVIGAPGVDRVGGGEGAVYLFHMDGTEVAKLTPGDDGKCYDRFGVSVSMDEKVVVGSFGNYFRVFSRQGTYERTITCDDCSDFGDNVATLGNLIVTQGTKNSIEKLFIYSTEDGQLLKTLEQGTYVSDIAMSENYIVSRTWGDKTFIFSNTSPDFPKIAEINQGGREVAVLGDRIVIGDGYANDYDGAAYLYTTDGTLITALDRKDASSGSSFGWSVAITDDKVLVGAQLDDDGGENTGSVFIYSAVTGDFVEKVLAPDGGTWDLFGSCVSASDSHYVVGAYGASVDNCSTGAAYLFQFSED